MFTDTHCHLTAPELAFRLPEILSGAAHAGITRFIAPSAQAADWPQAIQLTALPSVRAVGLGIHPWFAPPPARHTEQLHRLDRLLAQHPQALVGEIGLDFHPKHRSSHPPEQQTALFRAQLDLARRHRRPIILHNLKATAAVDRCLRDTAFTHGGFAHAFSGSLHEAETLIRHGFCIGIGTLLLNPNAKKVRHAAAVLPLHHLVLETDSPYMRSGNTNTPAALAAVARTLAELRGIGLDELAAQSEHTILRILNG